jgi:hypothetical protein
VVNVILNFKQSINQTEVSKKLYKLCIHMFKILFTFFLNNETHKSSRINNEMTENLSNPTGKFPYKLNIKRHKTFFLAFLFRNCHGTLSRRCSTLTRGSQTLVCLNLTRVWKTALFPLSELSLLRLRKPVHLTRSPMILMK